MGVILSPADLSNAQWDYLLDTFRAEMAVGKRLHGVSWKDATGASRTSSISDMRRSLHLWTQQTPPIAGVQLSGYLPEVMYTNRRWLVTEFTVRVAVQALAYGQTPANGDDAMAELCAFIADGNGNGFGEILRDPGNYTLGGNCKSARVTNIQPVLSIGDGNTPDIWAEAYITIKAEKPLAV